MIKARILTAFFVVLVLVSAMLMPIKGCAEDLNIGDQLAQMSVDELLALRYLIDGTLYDKGYVVYIAIERLDKGENVIQLQNRLEALGYYSGKITGKYDNETIKAMKLFEKANGLENDGIASIEDQAYLYSDLAIAKSVETTAAPSEAPTAKETVNPAYAAYESGDYTEYARYPEKFVGKKQVLFGKVVQVLGTRTSGFQLRLATGNYSTDIVYVYIDFDPGYNILEGDSLTVYATMADTITYEAVLGQSITIPAASADYLELH